jgi:F-type H+/Na+-transporting ATPase subunit alpha
VDVADIRGLEIELYQFADNRHPSLLREIVEKKQIDDDLKARLHDLMKEFTKDVIELKKAVA